MSDDREARRRRLISNIENLKREFMKDPWVKWLVEVMCDALDEFEKFLKWIDSKK